MDPDQTLKDIMALAHLIQDEEGAGDFDMAGAAEELATNVVELDHWIRKGGAAPQAWLAPITVAVLTGKDATDA